MSNVLLKKTNFDDYEYSKSDCSSLNFLAYFLITDAYDVAQFFVDWLMSVNNLSDSTGGNLVRIIIYDDTVTLDSMLFDEEYPENAITTSFSTTKQDMISILDQWIKILAMRPLPQEVLVEQDLNGKVKLMVKKS